MKQYTVMESSNNNRFLHVLISSNNIVLTAYRAETVSFRCQEVQVVGRWEANPLNPNTPQATRKEIVRMIHKRCSTVYNPVIQAILDTKLTPRRRKETAESTESSSPAPNTDCSST